MTKKRKEQKTENPTYLGGERERERIHTGRRNCLASRAQDGSSSPPSCLLLSFCWVTPENIHMYNVHTYMIHTYILCNTYTHIHTYNDTYNDTYICNGMEDHAT